jgi:hypothetical protein
VLPYSNRLRQQRGKAWQKREPDATCTNPSREFLMSKAKRNFTPNAVHLVRTTQQINLSLSQMADQKASILMGATFVVFTISVGQAGREGVTYAIFTLAFFSFISAMLAVFAIIPSIGSKGQPSRNILFFGTFSGMSEEEFTVAVLDNLDDDEAIYRLMLRDIYQNGLVLQRKKYRFLGLAYRTFLAGLILTVITIIAERFLI